MNADSAAQLQKPKISPPPQKKPCYTETSQYENDLMYWPYHHSGYTKQPKDTETFGRRRMLKL